MEPLNVKPQANVTITFATEQQNGVLLYTGDRQHLVRTAMALRAIIDIQNTTTIFIIQNIILKMSIYFYNRLCTYYAL
jgi:hypothetical protein